MSDQQEQHLADWFDRATAIEMEATETSIKQVQSRCKQKQQPRADGTYEFEDCEECGNPIGEGRLKVAINNHLCIFCQERSERFRKT